MQKKMGTAEGPYAADELLARRESLRERGILPTIEELCEGAPAEVREQVARRLADVLAAERAIEASWGGPTTGCDPSFIPQGRAGRYARPTIKAEGGMGVLCVAEDVELGRTVAYKVMKPGLDRNAAARARFFNEAEITAKLNHPGIVPVFGRVVDDSGLPAYASEYVSGHTMAAAIQQFHEIDDDEVSTRAEARTGLLRAFTATCQIIAYAHSQNVIHGDIKPLNIMIDAFGATRLVDWGVAKLVDEASAGDPEPGPRPGTPTFISSYETPATFASDIYALGLTLKWILAAPQGDSAGLRRAADTPLALWAVAEKATTDRDSRYRSAADLARDVEDVLDDKPVAPYRDPWPTRLRRWAARHRPAVATVLAVLAMAALVGPLVGARERVLRQRAESARIREDRLTAEMLDEAELVGKFQATLPGSKAIIDRTVRLIDQLARDTEAQGTDLRPAVVNYYRAGLIHFNLNQLPEAVDCFRRSGELAARRYAASAADSDNRNLWAAALRDWGVARIVQGHADDAAGAWEKALEILGPVADLAPDYRWTLARIHFAIGNRAMLGHDQTAAQVAFQEALTLASQLVDAYPDDPRFVKALADVYSNRGMSLQMQALPDGQQLVAPDKLSEAAASHRRALEHRRRLTQLEPGKPEHLADVATSLNHLGNAHLLGGDAGFANAEGFYREARTTLEALAIAYPGVPSNKREIATIYSNLNVLLTRQNRMDEVLELGKAAVELFRRLVSDYPATPDLHSELGTALDQLATNLRRQGKVSDAAARSYDAAVAFARAYRLTDDANRRSSFAKKALALLHLLDADGYFRTPSHAAALRDEPAFADFREQPGFPETRAGATDGLAR
jgi:eukaryotic-like serine/threonine-protein kinase